MSNYLVIVESPTKVTSIKKYLGSRYKVMASQGHVRDLPKSQIGIDLDQDYEPHYITIRGKGDILSALRKEVKKADKIYLATDPDREGEAIAWHLKHALNLDDKDVRRVSFNEITKDAVKQSFANARDIDMDKVDAQQARRALDRIVGYEISPLLWAKVKRGLSAGRVQSVALRIIADREAQIDAFIPEEYWNLDAVLYPEGSKKTLSVSFFGIDGKKKTLKSKKEVDELTESIKDEQFVISSLKKADRVRKAPTPFTTSTLQQDASKLLGFSTSKTMRIAQQLYEGVRVKGSGTVGLITYLRTDSIRIADTAAQAARQYIMDQYGKENVGTVRRQSSSKTVQDAHEAIRPTDITRTPVAIKDSLSRDQFRLYQLIWKRFTASCMADARYEQITVKVNAGHAVFTTTASKKTFAGYTTVYSSGEKDEKENRLLAELAEGQVLDLSKFVSEQHFTQPPPHFTEASLVKALEENGIGRPSTYAPTISTILQRRYITKEKKNLYITEIGQVVNDIMCKSFPGVVDIGFTARMEEQLDEVADGKLPWKDVLRHYWPPLKEEVEKAQKELEHVKLDDEQTDVICDKCGRRMVIKYGPHGKFLACPGFPECRNTKPYLERIGVQCPQCGADIVRKKTRKGRVYYGCENNPECDFMSWQKPISQKCPRCGGYMIERGQYNLCHDSACGYREKKKKEE
ncbi:MAG: type I DNA topoisomerase [Lachnospiraceae bacterium]|nr:type I DNA topoisomerase [Lachnospiraceae bacterium]